MTDGSTDPAFPDWFFTRADDADDALFYGPQRLVTHIDDAAIAAVGELYDELAIAGSVLDLMSSWISHFRTPPADLTVLGMNSAELEANPEATSRVVHDLNRDPALPFEDDTFDHVVCCVSVDYLTSPVEVFRDVARVLRPTGLFVHTLSNRCFPTKAIRGWLMLPESERPALVAAYFAMAGGYGPATLQQRVDGSVSDPLYAVFAPAT